MNVPPPKKQLVAKLSRNVVLSVLYILQRDLLGLRRIVLPEQRRVRLVHFRGDIVQQFLNARAPQGPG